MSNTLILMFDIQAQYMAMCYTKNLLGTGQNAYDFILFAMLKQNRLLTLINKEPYQILAFLTLKSSEFYFQKNFKLLIAFFAQTRIERVKHWT